MLQSFLYVLPLWAALSWLKDTMPDRGSMIRETFKTYDLTFSTRKFEELMMSAANLIRWNGQNFANHNERATKTITEEDIVLEYE